MFRSPYLDEGCNIECSVCGAMSKSFNRHGDHLLEDYSEIYAQEAWNKRCPNVQEVQFYTFISKLANGSFSNYEEAVNEAQKIIAEAQYD